MVEFDNYTQAIMIFLKKGKISDVDFLNDTKSNMFKSFLPILNNQIDQYLASVNELDVDSLDKNSLDFFYYLEGRIRYLQQICWKEIYYRQKSPIGKEFTLLCETAIEKFQFAYHASIGLAFQYQQKKQYKKSIPLLKNIYEFGFRSEAILETIIACAAFSRDWAITSNYIHLVQPRINRFLHKILLFDLRFPLFTFAYIFYLFIFTFSNIYSSVIALISLPTILLLFLLVAWKYYRSPLLFGRLLSYSAIFAVLLIVHLLFY